MTRKGDNEKGRKRDNEKERERREREREKERQREREKERVGRSVPPPLYHHYITSISPLHHRRISAIFLILEEIWTVLSFLML